MFLSSVCSIFFPEGQLLCCCWDNRNSCAHLSPGLFSVLSCMLARHGFLFSRSRGTWYEWAPYRFARRASDQLQRCEMSCEFRAHLPRWNHFCAHLEQRLNLQCGPCFPGLLGGMGQGLPPRGSAPCHIIPGHRDFSLQLNKTVYLLSLVSVRPFSAVGLCVL